MSEQTPCVFISYSHDGEAHRSRILELAQRLRKDGVPTILDRFVPNQSPPERWPRWMLDRLDQATHVLCVCTQTYYRRFRGHEVPGVGKGVDWEGAIITNELYDARSVSHKFIPILFDRLDEQFIPEPLRGQTFYILNSESSYDSLYDAILDQGGIEPHPVGVLRRKQRPTAAPSTFDDESAEAGAAALAVPSKTSGHTSQIATTQLSRHASRVLFGHEAELV